MKHSKIILVVSLITHVLVVSAQSTYTPPDWFRTSRQAPLTELATVQDILVSNYTTINDGLDDLQGIIQALDLAKAAASPSTPVRVVFESGTYDLFPTGTASHAIFFNYGNSVVLEGNGANIQMHNPEIGFFSMFGSKNIIIKDLVIDYAQLPFTQGVVKAKNFSNNSFTLDIDDGFPHLDEAYFANASESWGMLKEADGRLKSGVNNLFSTRNMLKLTGNEFQVYLNGNVLSQIAINDRYVQIARNNGRTIFRSNTGKNITYMGITSYASPAGSYNVFNHDEWSLINCKVLIKPGRIHSGNADILHINGGNIGPWVEGCRFEGQSDDAVNMKNTKLNILSVISPTEITTPTQLGTDDTISFYNPRDGIFLGRTGLTKPAESIGDGNYKLTLHKPINLTNISDANVGDKAYIETRMNESFVFINDTIRNGRRYGMLIQNGYGVIENCVFENMSNSAIRMENGVDWKEGFVAHKILIKNNKFIKNGFEKEYNDDPQASTITAMISKLGNGSCNPWCGTEITDWNGLEDIWIESNTFDYNGASINLNNYALSGIEDLSLSMGFTDIDLALDNAFDEILGTNWTLSASSSSSAVGTVSTSGKTLTLSEGGSEGQTFITISATNNSGGKAFSSFTVKVGESVFLGETDQFWSKASNWQAGQKPPSLSAVLIDADNSFVDESFTLRQISNQTDAQNTTISGNQIITLQNTTGANDPAILNQSDQATRLTFNTPLMVDNVTNAFTYLGIGGSSANVLAFGPESSLDIKTRTVTYSAENQASRTFEFNGRLLGNNNLIFGNSTTSVFGASSANHSFNGDLVFFENSKVSVETLKDSVFLPIGRKLQVNGTNTSLTLNTPNTVNGNVSIAGANSFTIEINKNQSAFQDLNLNTGALTLDIGTDVSLISFSAGNWTTGTLTIENFKNGVVKFGNSATTLNANQLGNINIGDGAVYLDANGYLMATADPVFRASAWSTTPSSSDNALIAGNYSAGSLEVNNLTIQTGVTASIASGETLKINGDLIIQGTLNISSGGSLVTLGNIAGEANISRTTTFGTTVGQYSVIGSPIENAETTVLGSTIYAYNEAIPFGSERFIKIVNPEEMAVGNAYFSAFMGAITFTGKPNTGNIDVPLIYNAARDGSAANAGFNLVSNPYPCAINYTTFVNTNPDIEATIYLWDDGGSDQVQRDNSDYIVINNMGTAGPGTGSGRLGDWNGYIGAVQGFFVKAASSGTLHFTDDMKVSGFNADANFFRNTKPAIQKLHIDLLSTETNQSYRTIIGFAEDATVSHDRSYDAAQLGNSEKFGVYSLMEDQFMTIQGLPLSPQTLTIPLSFTVLQSGTYALNFSEFSSMEGLDVSLIDHLSDQRISLTQTSEYLFTSNATRANTDRFSLVFSPSKVLNASLSEGVDLVATLKDLRISTSENYGISGVLQLLDISGKVLMNHSIVDSSEVIPFPFQRNRVYIINYSINGNPESKKILFK